MYVKPINKDDLYAKLKSIGADEETLNVVKEFKPIEIPCFKTAKMRFEALMIVRSLVEQAEKESEEDRAVVDALYTIVERSSVVVDEDAKEEKDSKPQETSEVQEEEPVEKVEEEEEPTEEVEE